MHPCNKVTLDEMAKALQDAGWYRTGGANVFKTPDGRLFRGPAMAYAMLMGAPWPPPRICHACRCEIDEKGECGCNPPDA